MYPPFSSILARSEWFLGASASDLTGCWRGLPPLWRPLKVRHFRQAGRLYPMRGSMQMILLTTWSGYLAKWTLPSHPGVSPMWNSLARNSSRSFSDPTASCQPEQALEELRLNITSLQKFLVSLVTLSPALLGLAKLTWIALESFFIRLIHSTGRTCMVKRIIKIWKSNWDLGLGSGDPIFFVFSKYWV